MGAPKGNKNHLMHGLYCKIISPFEAETANKMSRDLSDEILLLRVYVVRITLLLTGKLEYSHQDRELGSLVNRMIQTIGTLTTRRAYLNGEIGEDSMMIDAMVERNSARWAKA
jgi:hypothetical protein